MRPIGWSISGNDSGGGAGLTADQRAFDSFGVHLCPIVAAVTAQNSLGVARVQAVGADLLEAQLAALEHDLPPLVIKTGLLGSVEQVVVVARWIDRLRLRAPVALVVDPVLKASTGASFTSVELRRAYVRLLIPRATLVTPNRAEALALLQAHRQQGSSAADRTADAHADAQSGNEGLAAIPPLAKALRQLGAKAVCITGGDSEAVDDRMLDWLSTEHAEGWLASPRVDTRHNHGTGCTFASSAAAAFALGFVAADAVILAKMRTRQALIDSYEAGRGAGPVHATVSSTSVDAASMPMMSWAEAPVFAALASSDAPAFSCVPGLYGVVDNTALAIRTVKAGLKTVQLRIKAPPSPDAAWQAQLRNDLHAAALACRDHGALLVVNDHWNAALDLRAEGLPVGLHMGQEDMQTVGESVRRDIAGSGIPLGISSHSLWELCRARGSAPAYIACGPVWPTSTKEMPWVPQGLQNLSWWRAMAGVPVAAIGGVLTAAEVEGAAASGAELVCVVRALASPAGSIASHATSDTTSEATLGLPMRRADVLEDAVAALKQGWTRGRRRWLETIRRSAIAAYAKDGVPRFLHPTL